MNRIIKFIVLDILRNKIVLAYALILAALSWSVFALENNSMKGVLTLLNVILLTVPLVSVIFSTIYIYNSSEFIELLLGQPIRRRKLWRSLFGGLASALLLAFLVGTGIPILLYQPDILGLMMVGVGSLITLVFTALAFLSSILARDKAKGIGIAIMLWLFFSFLFDGLVLFMLFQFADYPIEKPMVVLTSLNPVDLARIMILLHMDVSAMMGYTGAIFREFFGSSFGLWAALGMLCLWIMVPFRISLRRFTQRDL
jgi:Cu-processing system permease protein